MQQCQLVVTLGYDKIHDRSQEVSPSQTVCVEGTGDVGSKSGLGDYVTHHNDTQEVLSFSRVT